jgi:hypothetical protein
MGAEKGAKFMESPSSSAMRGLRGLQEEASALFAT